MAVVFIGPWCAGKSTWSKRYAQMVGQQFLDLDSIAPGYGAELGWSVERLLRRNGEIGMLNSEREWEPVRAHIAERVLQDWSDRVIAFGASYTGYTDPGCRHRVRDALRSHSVVLVCPSMDDVETSQVCQHRAVQSRGQEWVDQRVDFDSWCPTSLDREMADAVLVTSGGSLTFTVFAGDESLVHGLSALCASEEGGENGA